VLVPNSIFLGLKGRGYHIARGGSRSLVWAFDMR
jgi:hypothetical protein